MKKTLLNTIALITLTFGANAQDKVTFAPQIQRYIGDVTEIDRTKYFNLHSTKSDTDLDQFYNDYNVMKSRGFWGAFSDDGNLPAGTFPPAEAHKNPGVEREIIKNYIQTEHPKTSFVYNIDAVEAGRWAAQYYMNRNANGPVAEYFEPMNEPFVHAWDFIPEGSNVSQTTIKEQMSAVFSEVGKAIHATPELKNMKVLGYSAAWPEVEKYDFEHWDDNQKLFMDIAGENMDGFATHIYDGTNVTGSPVQRSGSNSEAILDLIETYSWVKWRKVKPHALTEYGGIFRGTDELDGNGNPKGIYPPGWNDGKAVQSVRSNNHIIFNLLNRENDLLISVPFVTDKSEWYMNEGNNYTPYGAVILRPEVLGEAPNSNWVYTPKITFYDLWKDFEGKRVLSKSKNPDIQTHALVDGNRFQLALNNLADDDREVLLDNFNGFNIAGGLKEVIKKSLKIYWIESVGETIKPHEYKETTLTDAPNSVTLIPGETVILEYTFNNTLELENALRTTKYYCDDHIVPISGEKTFTFSGVETNTNGGYAYIRMSIGREHDKSKRPTVTINGSDVTVPDNWAGYDQEARETFFGMIEVPVPIALIEQGDNIVKINFSDTGGHISSVVLQVDLLDEYSNVKVNIKNSNEVSIFPTIIKNNTLNVSMKQNGDFSQLEILSINGSLVYSTPINIDETNLTISNLNISKGLYIVRLKGMRAFYTSKIIFQ